MNKLFPREIRFALILLTGLFLLSATNAHAQNHVVSPTDIQKDVASASATRQQNQEEIKNFLSSDEARHAMKSAHIHPQQVTTAISQLSDSDLAQLAARSQKAQQDFAAGNIDNRDLLIILVAIAVLILIIVAVH